MKHYRVSLWGYGGEAAYIGVTKEAYEYWKATIDEDGDSEVVSYMADPEEYLEEHTLPEGVDFMQHRSGNDTYYNPWYEAPNEFAHAWGGAMSGSMRLMVEEIESEEYMANLVPDGYEYESDLDKHEEEFDSVTYDTLKDYQGEPLVEPDYVCQFWSAEKGTFFEGILSIDGDFDPAKLNFVTEEYPNGDDVITDVQYDGESIDNQGGDTNGKGYSVHFWSNV